MRVMQRLGALSLTLLSCYHRPVEFRPFTTADGLKAGTVIHDVKDAADARGAVLAYCAGQDYALDAMDVAGGDGRRTTFTFHCDPPPRPFKGPRVLTLVGQPEDVEALALELGYRGFAVRLRTTTDVRYIARVDGVCGSRIASVDPTLSFEAFEGERSVFRLAAKTTNGCPEEFFVYVAETLSKIWADDR